MTIVNSTLSGNNAGNGGAIYHSRATLTVFGSTISGNNAVRGGGIYRQGGSLVVINSTVSGNTSVQEGGGIRIAGSSPVTISNVTITDNTASTGYGIYNSSGNGFTLKNTILAGNGGSDCNSNFMTFRRPQHCGKRLRVRGDCE